MKKALRLNPFVPVLMRHPTSLYLEGPPTYQVGFPDQALIFVTDFGTDWLCSMVGYFFLGAFEKQAGDLIKKGKRASRESYRQLLDELKRIDKPPWQGVVFGEMENLRRFGKK